jgi:CPA2 family monovalent cation:H+ antiporter-2
MTSGLEMVLVLLLAAVLAVVVFRRMGLPPLVAYLSLGISVGPHALGLLQDSADTRSLAEFGVVFLMFSVGIEFSLPQLVAMRRTVFGLGLAQVALTLGITAARGHRTRCGVRHVVHRYRL